VFRSIDDKNSKTEATDNVAMAAKADAGVIMINSSSLPRIGLGMAALGRPGYINLERCATLGANGRTLENMQAQAYQVLDQLFQSTDCPWIDCARSYGLSEKMVGEYLRERSIPPEKVFVSSKWGYSKSFIFSSPEVPFLFFYFFSIFQANHFSPRF
jgi:hypothetical protein